MILFLNGVAGSEILVILLFVLIFFGSKSIPGLSRSLGRGIRQIRDASQEIKDEIRKTTGDIRNEMDINRTIHEAKNKLTIPIEEAVSELDLNSDSIKVNSKEGKSGNNSNDKDDNES